jgi:hypothetical protein
MHPLQLMVWLCHEEQQIMWVVLQQPHATGSSGCGARAKVIRGRETREKEDEAKKDQDTHFQNVGFTCLTTLTLANCTEPAKERKIKVCRLPATRSRQ